MSTKKPTLMRKRRGSPSTRQIHRSGARPEATRAGTGQPAHFLKWKQDAAVKNHLQRMKVTWLAERVAAAGDLKISNTLHKLAVRYRNVWQLSQADRTDVLATLGVGPASLDKVEAYLTEHKVPLRWAQDGD